MRNKIKSIVKDAIAAKARLLYDEDLLRAIQDAARKIEKALRRGGKVLIFGNGGSAADSQHFAAELMGRFQKNRRALAALALSTDTSLLTAVANDFSFDRVFRRQVEALATPKDIAVAISTSGNSKNVLEAVAAAKKIGAETIGLTGNGGGRLSGSVDLCLRAPATVTARIQELHILIIHAICELVEEAFCK